MKLNTSVWKSLYNGLLEEFYQSIEIYTTKIFETCINGILMFFHITTSNWYVVYKYRSWSI